MAAYDLILATRDSDGCLWETLLNGNGGGDKVIEWNDTTKVFELADGGGGDHASTHTQGQGDEIDGDKLDIDWDPVNYAPTTVTSYTDHLDQLTSHLQGIDLEFDDTKKGVQNSSWTYGASVSTNDTYDITVSPTPDTYAAGQRFVFKASATNTGTANLKINGQNAKNIKKQYNQGLDNGDIKSGQLVEVAFDGDNDCWQMVSPVGNDPSLSDHGGTHVRGGGDTIDADQLDVSFSPSNYTRTTDAAFTNINHLGSHLKGIDASLAGGAAMSSWTLRGDSGSDDTITNAEVVDYAGGEGIATTATTDGLTIDLDISGSLTVDNSPDGTVDYVVTWDDSASSHKKVLLNNLPGGGGGEANTASNAGAGTSLFYQKSVYDLEFNGIKSENNLLTVALDGASHDIELTVNEGNIDGDQLDIDWNATNYDTDTSPAEVSSHDHLTAHLKGIDNQLASTDNLHWDYSSTTAGSDPGLATFRLNHASDLTLVTNIYVDDTPNANGLDAGSVFQGLGEGDLIYIEEDSNTYGLYALSGAPTDNIGWWTLPVAHKDSSGSTMPNNGNPLSFRFIPSKAQAIQSSAHTFAAGGGTGNAHTLALSPPIPAYKTGQRFLYTAPAGNTASVNLDVDGLGTKTIKKKHDQNLASGDIESGQVVEVVYDGTNFQMVSQLASSAGGGSMSSWTLQGDSGSDTISDSDTVDIEGGEGMSTAVTSGKSTVSLADISGYGVMCNKTSGASPPSGMLATNLLEEENPAAGDFLLGWESSGALRKFDVGDLPTGGGGEANDGTNLGAGVGVYSGKTGSNIEFHSLVAASTKVSISLDGPNEEIDIDITEGNINALNLNNGPAEANATADQTGAEIKTAYEGENFAANTILGNKDNSASPPEELTPTNVTTESDPASGDFVLGWDSSNLLRKFDVGALLGASSSVWVDSASMVPDETTGPEAVTVNGTNSSVDFLAFDQTTVESAYFKWMPPPDWDAGQIKAEIAWTNAGGSATHNTKWRINAVAVSNSDAWDASFTTNTDTTDDPLDTSGDLQTISTALLTIDGTPAVNDMIFFKVSRIAPSGTNLAADARLAGVRIHYTLG